MKRSLSRILYADDEPLLQKVTRATLEKMGGFTVCVVGSGQEVLDQVTEFAPDLILLDVMMPEMDGPSTLRHLQANPVLVKIPVVFLTAKAQAEEIQYLLDAGAVGLVTKPFEPYALVQSLQKIWDNLSESAS